MNVVLINPPIGSKEIFGEWDLSSLDTYSPPLGLLYIAGYLYERNYKPYILDAVALKYSFNELIDNITDLNPDIVGISSTTVNIENANRIAKKLKSQRLKAPIVLGGAHVTALPAETLKRYPSFDYGVIGEGEVTLNEFIENMRDSNAIRNIKGVVWRDESGKIIQNERRALIQDLDSLPLPKWDLLPNFPNAYPHSPLETKNLPAATIITSRGCPHHCTFCDRAVFGSNVRHHSAEYTLSMIKQLKKNYGISNFMIVDDNFLLSKKKLFQVCDTIINEKIAISWYCLGHIKYMTDDRLKKIREAGCWIMEVGIESGCDRILKFIKKNNSKNEIADAVSRAKKAGIKIKGNFIFGLPTETKESLQETIEFAKNIDISLFQQTFMTILPGCELSREADKYGTYEKDWRKLALYEISFVPNELSRDDLLNASKQAFREFYLRPKIIFENIRRLTSLRALKTALLSLSVFFKTITRRTASDVRK